MPAYVVLICSQGVFYYAVFFCFKNIRNTLYPQRMGTTSPLTTLGWREWVALPDLGISRIKVKVDSGARTSALHAFRVEPYEVGGQRRVRFWIHPLQRNTDYVIECDSEVMDQRVVTDSGGHAEERIVINTHVVIDGMQWPIEVTLTSRDTMKFRMLLGRTAIRERFLVDCSASYLAGKRKHEQR